MATQTVTANAIREVAARRGFILKPLQQETLHSVAIGNDTFAILPTGYGKTLIYCLLPDIMSKIDNADRRIVIVISPLVALMRDQVKNMERQGFHAVYLGDDLDADTYRTVENGDVPILLVSPESLFGEKTRKLLQSDIMKENVSCIVVDECHCVEQWGKEFRKDYSRLGEVRSLIPRASVLALTATATTENIKIICRLLSMTKTVTIGGNVQRENIFHSACKVSNNLHQSFGWISDKLKQDIKDFPKTIIYCRNIKACGQIYHYFMKSLGDKMYSGDIKSAKCCKIAMFHHSTSPKNKKIVQDVFPIPQSLIREVIATNAFGMGIDISDIRYVLHWGAPHDIESYQQQSGRAGRDGLPSFSTINYHLIDVSQVATDNTTRDFCKTNSCRQDIIFRYFSCQEKTSKNIHNCWDVCLSKCGCGMCPNLNDSVISNDDIDLAELDMEVSQYHQYVSDDQRALIKQLLTSMVISNSFSCLGLFDNTLITGLNMNAVDTITNNLHYILSVEDLKSEYIFDDDVANEVFSVIRSVTMQNADC